MKKEIFNVFEPIPNHIKLSDSVRKSNITFSNFEHSRKAVFAAMNSTSKGLGSIVNGKKTTKKEYVYKLDDLTNPEPKSIDQQYLN